MTTHPGVPYDHRGFIALIVGVILARSKQSRRVPPSRLSFPKEIYFCLLLFALLPLKAQDTPETRAMRDEMARSLKDLKLDPADRPYYISYRITDTTTESATASFGALTGATENKARLLSVTVRLGDYDFDSSNAPAGSGLAGLLGALSSSATALPLDDSYEELRRKIWLATDSAYKRAIEDLSAKKAARVNKTASSDPIPDFSKEPARQESETLPPIDLPLPQAEKIVRESSAVFRTLNSVETATASLTVTNTTERFLNSEGTSYLRQVPAVDFRSAASVQNKTAEIFSDSYSAYGRSWKELPPEATLVSGSQAVADRLNARLRGKVARKYNGPVLVLGAAAAELFGRSFASLLSSHRGESNNLFTSLLGGSTASLSGKIGSRVLPEFLTVTDNPLLTTFEGHPLFGDYKFDEEGVPAREVVLIKDGVLKTLLTNRNPARDQRVSTGSQRRHGVLPGNLFVDSAKSVSQDDLKAQLLDLLKARSLEFGFIVRSLAGNTALECTRLYPDGHEEPVRDARLAEISAGTFKDILAVSKERTFYTTRAGATSLEGLAPGGDDLITYVVPDLLFEDMTVEHVSNDHPKLPAEPNPIASN